jgi:hypothetical protein
VRDPRRPIGRRRHERIRIAVRLAELEGPDAEDALDLTLAFAVDETSKLERVHRDDTSGSGDRLNRSIHA